MIIFDSKNKIFNLCNENFSYIFCINKLGYLIHLYNGKKIGNIGIERTNEIMVERYATYDGTKEICDESYYFSQMGSRFECSSFLTANTRGSFASITHTDGTKLTNFLYHSHKTIYGKVDPKDLPHTRFNSKEDGETLIVTLKDVKEEIYLDLYYVIFRNLNVLVRFAKLINKTGKDIKINRISSFELNTPNDDYEIISLHGQWADDREIESTKITHSNLVVEDNRGARGFKQNPSVIVKNKNTSLDYGECYGISLVYSGDFKIEARLDEYDNLKLFAGINDENFGFVLQNNEEFYTPECIFAYSSNGINDLTHTFHDLARNHIIRKEFAFKERPLLINSWEPFLFDFDTEKIKKLIDDAKELDIDQVVLDDGWFGKRNNDRTSLGDWEVNEEKINLHEVIDYAHSKNIKFGLWIEPEMISPESNLMKEHPDFALFDRDVNPTLMRHQLVLDLTRDDVVDYIFDKICKIFDNYEIDYCKWDFNRTLSECGSLSLPKERWDEINYRFMLGTYKLFNRFVERYPNILLESCASGGGRFDFGMLYYSPQIWTSDNTNPYDRVMIQYATNLFYPLSSLGAHVSASPALGMQEKAIISMFGTAGYELDPSKLTENEKEQVKTFNKLIKEWHYVITEGDYYAIKNPYEDNFAQWNVVTKDKKVSLVFSFNYKGVQSKSRFIKVKGLDKDKYYFNSLTNDVYKGEFYMNVGINISAPLKEGMTILVVLKQVNGVVKVVANAKANKNKREKLL